MSALYPIAEISELTLADLALELKKKGTKKGVKEPLSLLRNKYNKHTTVIICLL